MNRILLTLFALALSAAAALAQSQPSPPWFQGYVPTPGQWNALWAGKQDYLGASPIIQGVGPYKVPVRTAVSTTDTISGSDYFVCPLNSASAATENLPASPTLGLSFLVKDCGGTAGTHTITVSGNGNNVDGASTYILNVNYQSAAFTWTGAQWSIN